MASAQTTNDKDDAPRESISARSSAAVEPQSYDGSEYVIRQVARGAIEAGAVYGFVRWAMTFFPQGKWRDDCWRIYLGEMHKRYKGQPEMEVPEKLRLSLARKLVECEMLCREYGLPYTRFTFLARDPAANDATVIVASNERSADVPTVLDKHRRAMEVDIEASRVLKRGDSFE